MSSPVLNLNSILGIEYVFGGLVMLWANLRVTEKFGLATTQERYALFRRMIYSLMSFSLFALGVLAFERFSVIRLDELAYDTVILFGIVVFPILRAFHFINQDSFMPSNDRPTSASGGGSQSRTVIIRASGSRPSNAPR
jgi:hypothetical protein